MLNDTLKQERHTAANAYNQKISAAIRLEDKPIPLTLHWWQKKERQYFFWRERHWWGRLTNALLYASFMGGDKYTKNLWHLLLNPQSRRMAMFRQQYAERTQSPKVQRIKKHRQVAMSKLADNAKALKDALKELHSQQREQEAWEWKMFNYKRYPLQNKNANGNHHAIAKHRTHRTNDKDVLITPHIISASPSAPSFR